MAFRNVIIASPAHISVKNDQLIVNTDRPHSIPIEDLSALLLESNRSTITTAALSQLGQCGCSVYLCDDKHTPCAILTSFLQHSRALSVMQQQLSLTEPRKTTLAKHRASKAYKPGACAKTGRKPNVGKAERFFLPRSLRRPGQSGSAGRQALFFFTIWR